MSCSTDSATPDAASLPRTETPQLKEENSGIGDVPVMRKVFLWPCRISPSLTVPTSKIPDQTVLLGDSVQLDLQTYFGDPDGDPLTYEATSANTSIAAVRVAGTTVTLSAVSTGSANVTVTARDPGGLTATQSFRVTGERGAESPSGGF